MVRKRARVLTDRDVSILKRIVEYEKHRPLNSLEENPQYPNPSPEIHVVLVPSGGIPARSGTTPGFADCDFYEMRKNLVSGDVELVDLEFTDVVYNISATEINPGFAVASRERFGYWVYDCACVQ